MYLYSGQDLLLRPTAWSWALPYWLKNIIGQLVAVNTYLRLQGGMELVLALILLAWFVRPAIVQWAALLSALEMATIILLALIPYRDVNFSITFRDLGILGGSLALFLLLHAKSFPQASPPGSMR